MGLTWIRRALKQVRWHVEGKTRKPWKPLTANSNKSNSFADTFVFGRGVQARVSAPAFAIA